MDRLRRQEIKDLADGIRHTLSLSVPVDVDRAVQLLGGTARDLEGGADPEAYVRKDGASFEIGVSDKGGTKRRRFSIAHELGHLFVHMGYLVDETLWNRVGDYEDSIKFRFGYSEEEHEANEFAGAFLMPEEEFRRVAEANKESDGYFVPPIAEHFNVSTDAAIVRGKWLGLFSWD